MSDYLTPRVRNSFSDRNGLNSIIKEVQVYEFCHDTRLFLQNKLLGLVDKQRNSYGKKDYLYDKQIMELLFNLESDSRKYYSSEGVNNAISNVFLNGKYYEILDVIEFFSKNINITLVNGKRFSNDEYCLMFNGYFELEFVGYRFVNSIIVKSTDDSANAAIENSSKTEYSVVNDHITKAVSFLSEKNKDPKNSIKESVMAVEQLCCKLANTPKYELPKAIEVLNRKRNLHPCMKAMIEKIYGFASDEEGIRHSSNEKKMNVCFDDALFILTTCASFINYAISFFKD